MKEIMKKLELLWGGSIFYTSSDVEQVKSHGAYLDCESPLVHSKELTIYLIQRSQEQEIPVVYRDEAGVYFACIRTRSGFYMIGPVCTEGLSRVQLREFFGTYNIPEKDGRHPMMISLGKLLNFISLLYELLEDVSVSSEVLIEKNQLAANDIELVEKEDAATQMKMVDDEIYHHTYQEERYVMDCIREGDTEHVLERIDALVENAGTLSGKMLNHQRNLAIVSVTAATREAIAGGVSPAEAYRKSDLYINCIDRCTHIEECFEYMRKSVLEFARMVSAVKREGNASNYTEKCKDYIYKNYHHKIYVEEISRVIGVSPGHLTRVFHHDTGISIQDYIQKFRVERAANLLKYSEASLSEISDYVCFNSQSHFGSVFKKYMNMTPRQYREQFKQKEFSTNQTGD